MPVDTQLSSRIQLFLECRHLPNYDVMSLSDPIVIVFLFDIRASRWVEVGRTEWIKDNLNPKFMHPIALEYTFEEVQPLRFSVYDVDKPSALHDLSKQDFIGLCDTTVAAVVTARSDSCSFQLVNTTRHAKGSSASAGTLIVRCEEVQNGINGMLRLDVAASDLPKMDLFGKSDPYLVFSRLLEDGSAVPVTKTEVIKNTLSPSWKTIQTNTQLLCNGDLERPVLIECFDWNRSGTPDFIGSFRAPVRAIVPGATFDLWDAEKADRRKKKGKPYTGSGRVVFRNVQFRREYSFLDFVRSGLELGFMVAIDFTASNGDPAHSNSLHYFDPMGFHQNAYEQAIRSIGAIVEPYDTDKRFPVLGFGGKLPTTGLVSHCFTIDPAAPGVEGMVASYRRALADVALSGPTLFEHIVRFAAQTALSQPDSYWILLIMTDGAIHDMQQTVAAIVEASMLPLSIIIIGVGQANFGDMHTLDADDVPLQAYGRVAERDIVQFVPFNQFASQPPWVLAKETCAELPTQVVQYMAKQGVTPEMVAARTRAMHQFEQQQQQPSQPQQQPQQQLSGPGSAVGASSSYEVAGHA